MFGCLPWVHAGLARRHPAFQMIAAGTGCNNVIPAGFSAKAPGDNVVDGQVTYLPAAILTGVIISTEDFFPRQLGDRPRAFDHVVESDDRWQGESLRDRVDDSPAIQN